MKKYFKFYVAISLAVSAIFLLSGCADKFIDYEEQLAIDKSIIKQYLRENSIDALEHASGLHYVINTEGTGDNPTLESRVSVKYTGKLLSTGEIFDQSTSAVTFDLNGLIVAWQIAIPLSKVGGKMTIYAPSGLCYGTSQVGSISPNSILIFEIELVAIVPKPA